MKPVMYIFANRGLGMSPGKLAAQVAHAAIEAYNLSSPSHILLDPFDPDRLERAKVLMGAWYDQGHPKIVMLAEDTDQLQWIERYLTERFYRSALIIDEGRTEIRPFTPTALGVQLVDKDDPKVAEHFGSFKTYREEKVPDPLEGTFLLKHLARWLNAK